MDLCPLSGSRCPVPPPSSHLFMHHLTWSQSFCFLNWVFIWAFEESEDLEEVSVSWCLRLWGVTNWGQSEQHFNVASSDLMEELNLCWEQRFLSETNTQEKLTLSSQENQWLFLSGLVYIKRRTGTSFMLNQSPTFHLPPHDNLSLNPFQ